MLSPKTNTPIEIRCLDYAVRRVDQMERSRITRGRGKPRKSRKETTKNDLEYKLEKDITFSKILCCMSFDSCNLVPRDKHGLLF